MTLAIGYEPNCGVIVIQGNGVFPARSLTASLSATLPNTIAIKDLGGRGEQTVVWGDLTSLDGSFTPASMTDALAYLNGEFAKGPVTGTPERNYALPSASGQPVFSLNPTPADVNTVTLLVNGVAYYPPDIAATSLAVMWQGPFPLDLTDAVRVVYF